MGAIQHREELNLFASRTNNVKLDGKITVTHGSQSRTFCSFPLQTTTKAALSTRAAFLV